MISLRGSVIQPKPGATFADVTLGGGIDINSLDAMDNEDEGAKAATAELFVKGGGIYIYACHGGLSPDLLQRIANHFRVTVYGFLNLIEFCPSREPPKGAKRVTRGSQTYIIRLARPRAKPVATIFTT